MARLINASINLDKLDKNKIVKGKKGNYYNFTIKIHDELNQYDQDTSIYDSQSKEERDAKAEKNYLGNGKTTWTNVTSNAPQEAEADYPF
jgi:hypothetical protein